MRTRILDTTDCAPSPLSGESRFRRQWVRQGVTSRYSVPYNEAQSARKSITGFTEFYFKGESQASRQSVAIAATEEDFENLQLTYEARCARRWWEEFRRWFGAQA